MLSVTVHGFAQVIAAGVLGLGVAACGAVYPEISTPVRVAGTRKLEPPPPADLVFLKFANAHIPKHTRDGRQWDSVGGSAPDPFAKLLIDDKEILLTPVQANTLSPTWPDQKLGNYRIPQGTPVRVELWDSNAINNHPICVETIGNLLAETSEEQNLELRCDSGATIEIVVQPAHAKFGLGLYYELGTDDIRVAGGAGQALAGGPVPAHPRPRRQRHGSGDCAQLDQLERLHGGDVHGQALGRLPERSDPEGRSDLPDRG